MNGEALDGNGNFDHCKTPFPWFGGKRHASPLVWELLGDVDHYVEPFAGGMAVLLNRPHPCNRPYFSETVNDLDGLLVNAWRSIAYSPDTTAEAASWPVSEADKLARQIELLRWRDEVALDHLAGDPFWHDPRMGGWWLWAVAVQIGAFAGDGPWTADRETGRIVKQARGPTREPGVARARPHLVNNGQGVNNAGLREPGVLDGFGGYHPITMPRLRLWFAHLAARLRHVRIVNGDWSRVMTTGAAQTLPVRQGGHCGFFIDPPYAADIRTKGLYAHDGDITADVRAWCRANGDNPKYRIVLAGFDTEHGELESAGWVAHEWFEDGWLRGGMAQINGEHQQQRERLWASPHCLGRAVSPQASLFEWLGASA